PLVGLVGVAAVATVRHTALDRLGRRDEIESVVAGLGRHGVGTGLGHVAFDAAAASAQWHVVGMLGEVLVTGADRRARSVASQAQGVAGGVLDGHRRVHRAVRLVTVGALQAGVIHHALDERVALDAVLVGRAVLPEFGGLLARLRLEALPEFG